MRCTNCNALLQDKARFCSFCGTPVVASRADHATKDSSTGGDNTSSSPVEPAEHSSMTAVALAQEEQPQPTSTETIAPLTTDELPQLEPTQVATTHEQQQPPPTATTDISIQDSPTSSEQTRIIVAPRIPPHSQPLKSIDTATTYEMPKVQTYVNSQPGETVAPALQISLRNTGKRATSETPIDKETPTHLPFLSPNTTSPSLSYFRLDTSNKVRYMLPAVINPQTGVVRRRKRGGLGCLITLLVLIVIIAGGWTFLLRPFLHNLAEEQLNQALSAAVNQIPAGASALPTSSLTISDTVINNLIVLNTSPSSPIQNPTTQITPTNIQIGFQLYGQPCSITSVPAVQNNQLVATNTTVSGIIGLVLSPSDITNIVNQHLADAQNRLQRSVKTVQLKDHQVDLTLG